MRRIPYLETGSAEVNRAFRIAIGDLMSNIVPFKDGLLPQEVEVVMAGMDYVTPWTRDAAINTWNGAGLIVPEVTKNTLLAVLGDFDGVIRIDGEYWDAIIWAAGAWWHYLYTGDKDFLSTAYQAVGHSLRYFEETEFSEEFGLFRGGSCYGDGISAYPDTYLTPDNRPGIIDWPLANPELAAKPGVGIPTHVLSTNCLYYLAYSLMGKMAAELGVQENPLWVVKAEKVKNAINRQLWNEESGRYDYFIDKLGRCHSQEGMGLSLAILFGVADEEKTRRIFENVHVTAAGIPCVWPSFERYNTTDGQGYGRHSGTVWPHIQGFWAHAAASAGRTDIFRHELDKLAEHASRDAHFAEIYHPVTGEIYGGRQEWHQNGIVEWKSCMRQTWSATAFMRMILMGMIGMEFSPAGIAFKPLVPENCSSVKLTGLRYRKMEIAISITGTGTTIKEFRINGEPRDRYELSSAGEGRVDVAIALGE